jgi:hypothetical protein
MKKKKHIAYWIITSLFGAFMMFSAIPDILVIPDAITFMTALGYPVYFIPFIGVAKALGVIAILIPGYPRIKEWAYAGLAYDLIGALYSIIAVNGFQADVLVMVLPLGFLTASYMLYHRKLKAA